ncbi:STT3 domain-containing protein [Nitrosophilus labii]|uniref:STT3 domain-containing protein n=1 Tax=Nitrosophilus labii TaxID=2706014 RepID=UPI001656C03D|nr:STT3 domain-containing protein [Nitrosophilus labii]
MFSNKEENISKKEIIVFIVLAFIFSITVRFYWYYWASGIDGFYWNNQIMINTNDGYFFASGAQKELFGMHQFNPLVPGFWDRGLVFITTILAKVLPFSLDTIILFISAFFSSFIVIPLVLLGRLYGNSWIGFFAALLGSIVWSYYNRTMIGYYDTDMFSVSILMFVFYFLVASIKRKNYYDTFWAAVVSAIYPFFYIPGQNVLYGLIIAYTIYLAIFHRRDSFFYPSLIVLYISLFPLFFIFKLILVIVSFIVLKKEFISKQYEKYIAFGVIAIFFLWSDALLRIWQKIDAYFFKHGTENQGLHFFKVMQTVREASSIPFETLANRISGHVATFLLAMVGYIVLLFKERSFWISLVLVGLGLFAITGGLRFTIYAVPFLAFSLVYLFWFMFYKIEKNIFRYLLVGVLTFFTLLPNILHVVDYKVPTVFTKKEVADLNRLKNIGSSKDFVLTWWDYGYPIWYYADKCTLIDGGKHNHDNFIVSTILSTNSQLQAARLARISVETYVKQVEWYKRYKEEGLDLSEIPEEFIFQKKGRKSFVANPGFPVADVIFQNGKKSQIDPNDFLEELKYGDVKLPKKTREIYIYLPLRMMEIFSTVKLFSSIDLKTGKKTSSPFMFYSERFKDTKDLLIFERGVALDKKSGVLLIGKQKVPIKDFFTVGFTKDGKVVKQKQSLRKNAPLSVISLSSYQSFLIVDDEMLNSLYIQMFVFDNYDKDLFEPIVISPWSKIYRVKI